MNRFIAAVVQMDSQDSVGKNLDTAAALVEEAARRGAQLVALPEGMHYLGRDPAGHAEEIPGGPTFRRMSQLAREHGLWLHCGSIYERTPEDPRPFNTTMVINPQGELAARYRKLHPFDVVIPNGPEHRESRQVCPGREIVTVDTGEVGKLGLAICYDLRFGELFRLMALEGAQILLEPANFTMPTGKDHWEVLLRARAIEKGCYVLAPAQCGQKPDFQAYGNAMIVDPWGTVIARASDRTQVVTAEIDLDYVAQVRRQLFTLENRREDVYSLRPVE